MTIGTIGCVAFLFFGSAASLRVEQAVRKQRALGLVARQGALVARTCRCPRPLSPGPGLRTPDNCARVCRSIAANGVEFGAPSPKLLARRQAAGTACARATAPSVPRVCGANGTFPCRRENR